MKLQGLLGQAEGFGTHGGLSWCHPETRLLQVHAWVEPDRLVLHQEGQAFWPSRSRPVQG